MYLNLIYIIDLACIRDNDNIFELIYNITECGF